MNETTTSADSVTLVFEDNLIDGKFSPFAKVATRLSRQSRIELTPLRTVSSAYYERLIEVAAVTVAFAISRSRSSALPCKLTCSTSNPSPLQEKTELPYRVTVRLQWNEVGPQ